MVWQLTSRRTEERTMMKVALNKMFLTLAGAMLVIPFAAIALLAGSRAVQVAPITKFNLLLVALAVGGTIASSLTTQRKHGGRRF